MGFFSSKKKFLVFFPIRSFIWPREGKKNTTQYKYNRKLLNSQQQKNKIPCS